MARWSKYLGWPLAAATGYGAISLMAHRSVYYPMKYPAGWWDIQPQAGASDVWLTAADGVKIHAWWIAPTQAPLATLFLHGNAGNITHRASRIPAITGAGSALLLLDYRGYGKSQGRPAEAGLYADADAAYRHLVSTGWAPERIVLHGESLGCAVAVDLASRQPCGGVVLEAPFTSAREVAARVLPLLGPLVIWGFDSKSKIGRVRAPLLVLHGERDEVIDFDLGRRLFEAARPPKSFWALPGAGHNDIVEQAGAAYPARLKAFYQSVLSSATLEPAGGL